MKKSILGAMMAAAMVLAACQTTRPPQPAQPQASSGGPAQPAAGPAQSAAALLSGRPAATGTPLTADEIRAEIIGSYLLGVTSRDEEFVLFHSPDGVATMKLRSGREFPGNWTSVDGRGVCYASGACIRFNRRGRVYELLAPDGSVANEYQRLTTKPEWF